MLKDADSTLVLEDGNLVGFGPHDNLLQDCALYKKLWRQQMELT
jgi:ATP-binding cassette subfamily B protein